MELANSYIMYVSFYSWFARQKKKSFKKLSQCQEKVFNIFASWASWAFWAIKYVFLLNRNWSKGLEKLDCQKQKFVSKLNLTLQWQKKCPKKVEQFCVHTKGTFLENFYNVFICFFYQRFFFELCLNFKLCQVFSSHHAQETTIFWRKTLLSSFFPTFFMKMVGAFCGSCTDTG